MHSTALPSRLRLCNILTKTDEDELGFINCSNNVIRWHWKIEFLLPKHSEIYLHMYTFSFSLSEVYFHEKFIENALEWRCNKSQKLAKNVQ